MDDGAPDGPDLRELGSPIEPLMPDLGLACLRFILVLAAKRALLLWFYEPEALAWGLRPPFPTPWLNI